MGARKPDAAISIERRIFLIRGEKVMLSTDLAALYGVEARALVQAVRRHSANFPPDFMFQLTNEEFSVLKSQIVISSWGGLRRANPLAFTQEGVAMLSSVLRSSRAIQVNIAIMRAFVRFRQWLADKKELAERLNEIERSCDSRFRIVFDAIRRLTRQSKKPLRRIGFRP